MTSPKRCLMIERKGTAMNTPHATGKMWELFNGDCLHVMRNMAAESVDSIVTDPPYGLSFMGKDWDRGVPGSPFWVEALRVAKPGRLGNPRLRDVGSWDGVPEIAQYRKGD